MNTHNMFLWRAGENLPRTIIKYSSFTSPLGPVVQSIDCLTSSLVAKMLTVLIRTISNSHIFLLKKCE